MQLMGVYLLEEGGLVGINDSPPRKVCEVETVYRLVRGELEASASRSLAAQNAVALEFRRL